MCLAWIVAFDHGQVDAAGSADPLGRAEQAGADVRILNGGAGEPFQGGGHDVGPAGLMGQDEGVAEVPRNGAGLSELVVGIAQAAAGVGEAELRASS